MRTFLLGMVLGVAVGAGIVEMKGQGLPSQAPAYVSAVEVVATLQKLDASNGDSPVLHLDPYTVLAEHRVATKNPATTASIHKDEAELYYGIEGSATLVTGRTPAHHILGPFGAQRSAALGSEAGGAWREEWQEKSGDRHRAKVSGLAASFVGKRRGVRTAAQ